MAVNPNYNPPAWAAALKRRREELGEREGVRLTQEELASRTGDVVAQRTISHLEKGTVELPSLAMNRVTALAKALNWSLYDLQEKTGIDLGVEGPLAKGFDAAPLEIRYITDGGVIGAGWNFNSMAYSRHAKKAVTNNDYLDRFSDDILFTLTVQGDSMTCADVRFSIPEKTTVIMAKIEPQPGDVIAVYLPEYDMGILKIFRPQEDSVVLESYNREHQPIRMTLETEFEIQGVMVGQVSMGRRAHLRR